MHLTSSPSSPTDIYRDIGKLEFHLNTEAFTISELEGPGLYRFTISEALALMVFFRGPGVASLLNRAWLAEQHAAALARADDDADDADDETRHKLHAGARKAA